MSYFFRQLFPPVIPHSLPAYDGTESVNIYFQLSIGNSREQFKHLQVTLHHAYTNRQALSTIQYPMGIIFIKNQHIFYDSGRDMYYFTLPAGLLPLDQFYKLQIRVGEQDITNMSSDDLNYNWLNNPIEASKFSEWSTVCVIKPITPPSFGLEGFQSKNPNGSYVEPVYDPNGSSINVVPTQMFNFQGFFRPRDPDRRERLRSYEMFLYEDPGDIDESLWVPTSRSGRKTIGEFGATNIQHVFDYMLERGRYYYVRLVITTMDGYEGEITYKLYCMFPLVLLGANLIVQPSNEKSKVEITVSGSSLPNEVTAIVVKRSCERSNFRKWVDVGMTLFSQSDVGESFLVHYEDVFVESGVEYRYVTQPVSGSHFGPVSDYVSAKLDYQHPWLIGEDGLQLMFGYGANVTNFTVQTRDTVVDTIGSKFPFVLRNANVEYKQFQFSATVTRHMDVEGRFYRAGETDFIAEREFRDRVIEFLTNGKPKVFKSDAEGLMLVRLTDISFTPKNELGRLVYDLTCTVTQIGEMDFKVLEDLKIKKGANRYAL